PVAITFRAPQRGEATETTLPGDGPWLVRIWLPVHAASQTYDAQIRPAGEASRSLADGPVRPGPSAQAVFLTLPAALAPGRYQLVLAPRDAERTEDAVYAFRVAGRR